MSSAFTINSHIGIFTVNLVNLVRYFLAVSEAINLSPKIRVPKNAQINHLMSCRMDTTETASLYSWHRTPSDFSQNQIFTGVDRLLRARRGEFTQVLVRQ